MDYLSPVSEPARHSAFRHTCVWLAQEFGRVNQCQCLPRARRALRAAGGRSGPGRGTDLVGLVGGPGGLEGHRPQAIVTDVLDNVAPGAVVVLHDGGGDRLATVAAVDLLVPRLQSAGYTLVGLPR
jgi:peptidoglycan/xylan/chitin deacetylase (PgdA/CDA1 family)